MFGATLRLTYSYSSGVRGWVRGDDNVNHGELSGALGSVVEGAWEARYRATNALALYIQKRRQDRHPFIHCCDRLVSERRGQQVDRYDRTGTVPSFGQRLLANAEPASVDFTGTITHQEKSATNVPCDR